MKKEIYLFYFMEIFLYLRLVCGDVEGHFKTLFTKVAVLHKKKGPFEVSMKLKYSRISTYLRKYTFILIV